jgi:catechol 2,3-dioxygenase-like lactoylglutathione lyase family enzyme
MALRYVLLLQRDLPKAVRFYNEGLGLTVKTATERWAELEGGACRIALKAVDGCAAVASSAAAPAAAAAWPSRPQRITTTSCRAPASLLPPQGGATDRAHARVGVQRGRPAGHTDTAAPAWGDDGRESPLPVRRQGAHPVAALVVGASRSDASAHRPASDPCRRLPQSEGQTARF